MNDVKDWIDQACGFGVWVMNEEKIIPTHVMVMAGATSLATGKVYHLAITVGVPESRLLNDLPMGAHIPETSKSIVQDEALNMIKTFLDNPQHPQSMPKQKQ